MKSTKRIVLTLLLLTSTLAGFSQIDTSERHDFVYNKVYKNIVAYHINIAANAGGTFLPGGFLKDGLTTDFFDRYLPDIGSKLEMNITRLDWKYPVDGYEVYQASLNGFRYSDTTRGKIHLFGSNDGPISFDNYYIFCVKGRLIKFIAGNYFVNDISSDFHLNKKYPESYLDYLKFRAFPMQVDGITFVRKRNQKYIYKGHSREINKDVFISIDVCKWTNLEVRTHL